MTDSKIKCIRNNLGYSIAEMAQALGLTKATYQHYDEGSRATPESVLLEAEAEVERNKEWGKRYLPGVIFDQELIEKYPNGIIS